MKVTGDWLSDPDIQAVFGLLEDGGHLVLAVGGCVRDTLLGKPVRDIDLTTDATPDQVTALAAVSGLKAIPTGADHGTITLISGNATVEVTTLRRDLDSDGRHATVAYGASVEDDARRRDFTMNALYCDRHGTLRDPVRGLPDLLANRVRFVGDADQRVREDYLRILRFFRFTAHYGDPANGIDADGLAACAGGAEGLTHVSRERIGAEVAKLLCAADPAPAMAAMQASGVLWRILPGAEASGLALLVHYENVILAGPAPVRRLAMIGGEDPTARLRLSRADATRLTLLRDLIGDPADLAEVAWRHGGEVATDTALLRAASFQSALPDDLTGQIKTGADAQFPVTAGDLMPQFQGPALGAELARLQSLWVASGFTLTRAALLG